ncbi:MAG: hypothetical protein OEY77_00270 [Nitrospira sp.]|nr:hypothetical protein [Nitrospira sp.]
MPTFVGTDVINFDELRHAFESAPRLVHRNVKTELVRFAKRVRRKTIRERLNGPPGIKGGQLKRGKHVRGFTTGSDLASLKAVNKISRVLRVHEEGHTFHPTRGAEWIYLRKKTGQKGKGAIFARVKQVVIKPRLGFEKVWKQEVPDGLKKVGDGTVRALRQAMDERMKALTASVQRIVR